MKAVRKLIILAMACVFLCTQGIAVSESSPTVPPLRHILDISLTVSPDELVTSGDVELTFNVSNNSDYTAANIYIESADGRYSATMGMLAPGEAQTYSRTYTVSEEELDSGRLSFTVSHDDIIASGGEPVVYTIDALVSRTEPHADIEFTRQISVHEAAAGDTVMLIYRVRNTGNVPLADVRVQDKLGSFTGIAETLEPGDERVFTGSITVEKDVYSEAKVSYRAPLSDDEEYTVKLDKASVKVVEPAVSVGLTLDRQSAAYGDTVNGVVTIAAEGADISDVVVYDDVNNTILADTIEVRAGESATITCSWPVRGSSVYRVRIEGINTTGAKVNAVSSGVEVALEGEFAASSLSLTAQAQSPRINRKGMTRISVAITNDGNTAVRDVVLAENTLGEIRTFEFIPAGEPTVMSVLADVQEDCEFIFSISYTAADGTVNTVSAEPVSVVIASDGAEPVRDEKDAGSAEKYEIRTANQYFWMIGAGGAVLLVLIILLIVSHDRERREKKLRRQLDKQRRSDSKSARRDKSPASK